MIGRIGTAGPFHEFKVLLVILSCPRFSGSVQGPVQPAGGNHFFEFHCCRPTVIAEPFPSPGSFTFQLKGRQSAAWGHAACNGIAATCAPRGGTVAAPCRPRAPTRRCSLRKMEVHRITRLSR